MITVRCGTPLRGGRLNFAQPPLEKPALAVVGDQCQRARVALRRFLGGSEAAQQIGAGGMQQVIVVEIAGLRPAHRSVASAGWGPSTIATATARFSDTTGEGCTRSSRS